MYINKIQKFVLTFFQTDEVDKWILKKGVRSKIHLDIKNLKMVVLEIFRKSPKR